MRHGLGSEHPFCDKIQFLLLILFFGLWVIGTMSLFIFRCSTVIFNALAFPLLFAGTILLCGLSFYLVSKSHKGVLEQTHDPPKLVDSGDDYKAYMKRVPRANFLLGLSRMSRRRRNQSQENS